MSMEHKCPSQGKQKYEEPEKGRQGSIHPDYASDKNIKSIKNTQPEKLLMKIDGRSDKGKTI